MILVNRNKVQFLDLEKLFYLSNSKRVAAIRKINFSVSYNEEREHYIGKRRNEQISFPNENRIFKQDELIDLKLANYLWTGRSYYKPTDEELEPKYVQDTGLDILTYTSWNTKNKKILDYIFFEKYNCFNVNNPDDQYVTFLLKQKTYKIDTEIGNIAFLETQRGITLGQDFINATKYYFFKTTRLTHLSDTLLANQARESKDFYNILVLIETDCYKIILFP